MSNSHFTDLQLDRISDELADKGYCIIDSQLTNSLLMQLKNTAMSFSSNHWSPAGIGRADNFQVNKTIRSDSIHWLSNDSAGEVLFMSVMDHLRCGLNQRLFLGLFDYESHFARYQAGQFYVKHIDALKGKSNRVLSTVLYLNEDWQSADAGELCLYNESDVKLTTVLPSLGTLVIFLSESFPHEVLAANKERYSIAGWFRINTSQSNNIDPSR
jgi:SM-20-related protein